jgi:hypothetical protein
MTYPIKYSLNYLVNLEFGNNQYFNLKIQLIPHV